MSYIRLQKSDFWYQTSGIRHQTIGIRQKPESMWRKAAVSRRQASDRRQQTSDSTITITIFFAAQYLVPFHKQKERMWKKVGRKAKECDVKLIMQIVGLWQKFHITRKAMTKMRNAGSGKAKGLWKSKPALSTGIYNLRYCSLICYFSRTLLKLFVKKESLIHSLSATNDFFSLGGGRFFISILLLNNLRVSYFQK